MEGDTYTQEWATAKFNEWFPEYQWEAKDVGAFKCIWASERMEGRIGDFDVRGEFIERVARCRTWKAALIRAKTWAWRNRKQYIKREGR